MYKYTENKIPKCMIEFEGLPFIEYQLQWLSANGVTEVILCIGHLGNMIKDYVEDGSKWNIKVSYIEDGDILCGTGGALRKAYDANMLNDSFLVTYGDSFLPISFQEVFDFFKNQTASSLMVVYNNQDKLDKSNAVINAGYVYYDKSEKNGFNFTHIDYGLSAFKKEVISNIPSGIKYDLADLFHQLSLELKLVGFETDKRFYEIGSIDGFYDFHLFVRWAKQCQTAV